MSAPDALASAATSAVPAAVPDSKGCGLEDATESLLAGCKDVHVSMSFMFDHSAGTFEGACFGSTGAPEPPESEMTEAYKAARAERARRYEVGFMCYVPTPTADRYREVMDFARRWSDREGPRIKLWSHRGSETVTTSTVKPEHEEAKRALDARNDKRAHEIDELTQRLADLGCSTDELWRGGGEQPPPAWFDRTARDSFDHAYVQLALLGGTALAAILRKRGAKL
jgi:hypothetical protein